MLLEDKVEDFITNGNLSKDDALKPENVKALKKILKKNEEFVKGKIEKYFEKHPETSSSGVSDGDGSASEPEIKVPEKV